MPNFFQDFPNGEDVQSSLGIDDQQLAALPTNVLNLPPYGNWTDQGWNVRFHGNVYKQPDISQEKVDDLANIFLIGTDIKDLPPNEQEQARNLTRSIFVVQQADQNVSMYLEPAPMQGGDGEPGGGNSIQPPGGSQNVTLPYLTTAQGDFDVFVPIKNVSDGGLLAGNETNNIQRLNVYTHGTLTGNATAFLVPPTGITFVSDIDDILRVTKIYDPKEGLLNSFARPFTPWMNMPAVYADWSKSLPNNTHFHYLTTTPEQATRNYMDFIYKTYPVGSFDTVRPLFPIPPFIQYSATNNAVCSALSTSLTSPPPYPSENGSLPEFSKLFRNANLSSSLTTQTPTSCPITPSLRTTTPTKSNASSSATHPPRTRATSSPTIPRASRAWTKGCTCFSRCQMISGV